MLKIPLFSFAFKKDLPDKKRMGVISEDLPKHLQVKAEPILPDLPSIRGILLASVKALHKKLLDLRMEFGLKLKATREQLLKELKDLNEFKEDVLKSIKYLYSSVNELKHKFVIEFKDLNRRLEYNKKGTFKRDKKEGGGLC